MVKVSYNRTRRARAVLFRSFLLVCIVAVSVLASFFTGCKLNRTESGKRLISHGKIRGEVELVAESQSNKQTGGSEGRSTTTTTFEERLRFRTKGNVYHPKLVSFAAAVGVGLLQHDFDSSEGGRKTSGTIHEYDFSADILKAKPYPININTSKSQNIIPRQFLGALKTEDESSVINLNIRSQKWPMNFQYSTTSTTQDSFGSTSGSSSSDFSKRTENRFRYGLSHSFNPKSRLRFNFERNETISESLNSNRTTIRDNYQTDHNLIFGDSGQYNLYSSVDFTENSGFSSTDELRWDERFKVKHSNNFATDYLFRFTESKNALNTNTKTEWEGGFKHRLYESLTTSGRFNLSELKIGSISENKRQRANLIFSYRKKNPFGTFSSSYNTTLTQSDQSGGSGIDEVVDESHFAVFGSIPLNRRNIDISTIRVEDENGDPYHIGSDYTVTEINGRVQLEILLFGGAAPFFSAYDGKEFFVDYEYFIEPERKEETLSQRLYVRQDLKFGLGLFYEFSRTDQSITSNTTFVTPDESRGNTYGFDFRKGRFSLYGEYKTLDSTQIVSTTKRLRARYRWNINPTTTVNIHALKEIFNYTFPNTSENTIFRFGGELTNELTNRLSVNTGFNYLETEDSGSDKTTGIQFRSDLRYRYRQIFLSTGLDYNRLESSGSKNDSLFLYIRAKRFF